MAWGPNNEEVELLERFWVQLVLSLAGLLTWIVGSLWLYREHPDFFNKLLMATGFV